MSKLGCPADGVRRRPRTALGQPRGLVGVGPDPISGLRGPNLPTDLKTRSTRSDEAVMQSYVVP
jgi:hypothetical protein